MKEHKKYELRDTNLPAKHPGLTFGKDRKLVLSIIAAVLLVFLISSTATGENVIPPVPGNTSLLPANDGEPDGCNSSRFKCIMAGQAVLDKQTGLTWMRDSQFLGKTVPWDKAMELCRNIEIGDRKDWRLPTRDEMITILDTSRSAPALPDGHPFLNVSSNWHESYWTSTECHDVSGCAWIVSMNDGNVMDSLKLFDELVWLVRDDN